MEDLSLVNDELSRRIVGIVELGNKMEISGSHEEALLKYASAWSLLPEPPQKWDLSHWIAGCKAQLFFELKKYEDAKKWALISIETKPPRETSCFIIYGGICYELQDFDEAYSYFHKAFSLGKKRAFDGFDKKYLNFYLEKLKG